jgi:hypothetical protein
MLAALRVPGRVHGLLLANTGAHTAGQRNADMPDRVRNHFGTDLVAEFIDRCHDRPLKPGARDALIRHALDGDPARYLEAFVSIRRIDLRADLNRIRTAVLYGRTDRESGHGSPLEDPQAFQQALTGLAARIPLPPAVPCTSPGKLQQLRPQGSRSHARRSSESCQDRPAPRPRCIQPRRTQAPSIVRDNQGQSPGRRESHGHL